ncbi:MAG: type II secretion system protein GspG [Lentisphaerae bacterium RIFOXYA12_FULL_48_11]|nr:MAG: type II secretion system protein GspG [Lentisphaerae bacterium RIFOXYA12_FULL_48_11]
MRKSAQINSKNRRLCRAGFTLVEVLLVVVILGILASVVVVSVGGKQKGAMIKATRASISAICTAIDLYEVDTGKYPSSLQSLISSAGEPNWNGPYLKGGMPVDAWGTSFSYTPKGDNNYEVRSGGPDKQVGSEDDITSFTNDGT